ncbi:hypothetical protein Areg01_46920 [Actinoplanes regularis]|nr:hypothetical protein Areg01_46920 [Actinoplanes regularis]
MISPAAFGQLGAGRLDAGDGCPTFAVGSVFTAFTGTSGTGFADGGECSFGAAEASGVSAKLTNNATTRLAATPAVRCLNRDLRAGGKPAGTGELT